MNNCIRHRILRNVASNYAGYFINIFVSLILSPFIVRTLGDTNYGIWVLLNSISGYYGLLDLGVRGAVGQYVARYFAQEDADGVNRTVNTSLVLMGGTFFAVITVSGIVVWLLPEWLSIPADKIAETRIAAGVMGVLFALTPPMAVWSAVIIARERFDIANLLGIGSRIISAMGTVWVLSTGYGMVGLSILHLTIAVLGWFASYRLCLRLVPTLMFSFSNFSKQSMRDIFGFGIFSFIGRLASQVVDYTDALVIIFIMKDPVAVTYYTVGQMLIPHFRSFLGAATQTILPYATACDAREDREALSRLLISSTRWTFLLATIIVVTILFLGRKFLITWMGEKYVSGDMYISSALILNILSVGMYIRMFQYCGLQVLLGMRKVKFLAYTGTCEAGLNLVLSLILAPYYGLVGVAVGTLIPAVIFMGYVEPDNLLRNLRLGWAAYLSSVLPSSLMALVSMCLAHWLLGFVHFAQGWAGLFLESIGTVGAGALTGTLCILTKAERNSIRGVVQQLFRLKAREEK